MAADGRYFFFVPNVMIRIPRIPTPITDMTIEFWLRSVVAQWSMNREK
jgi:hypothetical protein